VSSDSPTAAVVIGIGNPMRSDDGIGAAAVALLQNTVDCIALDGEATRLIDAWEGRAHAIVIDAVISGAPAGTVHRLDPERDTLPATPAAISSHAAGLSEALELARVLDRLPERLTVYGVEAADVSPGPDLSPEVAVALPELLARIKTELGQ
jgi:hydrogenase maturation protease